MAQYNLYLFGHHGGTCHESFRNYEGFSIIFQKMMCNLTHYESEKFPGLRRIFPSENVRLISFYSTKISLTWVVKCEIRKSQGFIR